MTYILNKARSLLIVVSCLSQRYQVLTQLQFNSESFLISVGTWYLLKLGSTSVPFKFDIHAMIFSNDAVGLENQLHQLLQKQRVNKVNLRKEFFETTVHELQEIVEEIDPTVEFKATLLAQGYYQSQELKEEQFTTVG